MAVTASLDIALRAHTDQATGKLLKASNVLGTLKNSLISAAAAYLSFNGAVRAVNATLGGLKSLDDLGESARKLNMTAESLLAMRNAAELAGGDISGLENSLFKMQRTIGEALQGGGAGEVFERLGLSVQQLRAMQPEQAFGAIAQAIMQLPSASEQAAAAVDVFGRSAKDILPLMKDSAEQFEKSRELLRRFGFEISDLDMKKIGATQDAFDQLRQAISMAWQVLSIKLLPYLMVAAQVLIGMTATALAFGKALIDALSTTPGQFVMFTASVVAMSAAITATIAIVFQLVKAFGAVAKSLALVQALSGPKGWLVVGAAVAGTIALFEGVDVLLSDVEKKWEKFQEEAKGGIDFEKAKSDIAKLSEMVDGFNPESKTAKAKVELDFVDPFGMSVQLPKLFEQKVMTIRANLEPVEKGSQEDLAKRFAVDMKVQQNIQVSQLNEQKAGNDIMRDMLDEMRRQTDELTSDADL